MPKPWVRVEQAAEEESQALVEDGAGQQAQHAEGTQEPRPVREYQLTPIASSPTRLGSQDGALLRSGSLNGGISRGLPE